MSYYNYDETTAAATPFFYLYRDHRDGVRVEWKGGNDLFTRMKMCTGNHTATCTAMHSHSHTHTGTDTHRHLRTYRQADRERHDDKKYRDAASYFAWNFNAALAI